MKRILIYVFAMVFGMTVSAQNPKGKFSIKPMAGINVTGFSGGAISDLYHYKVRFTAGLEAEYGINPWLGVSLGAIYSQQGTKIDGTVNMILASEGTTYLSSTQINGKIHSEYINIPLMANIYIPGVKGLAVKAGIQIGFLVGSKIEADSQNTIVSYDQPNGFEIGTTQGTNESPYFVRASVSQSDVCKSFDIGIPVGLSYEYKNVVLDARYYFGLTKIDNTREPEDCRNRHFSFTLGYRFHL